MKRLILLLSALAATGCSDPNFAGNSGVETAKAPTVRTSRLTYDVHFGPGNRLPDAQARALDQYLASIGVAYGDRIAVDDPMRPGTAERRQAIADIVGRYGLLLDGVVPVTTGNLPAGTVRVVVTRARAVVEACPDWSRPSEYEPDAAILSNFGCAVRGNLAEMIADPNDLVVGKAYDGADGQTAASALGAYRNPAAKAGASAAGPMTK